MAHQPLEVRQISPLISKFQRLSTIASVASSLESEENGEGKV